MLKKFLLLIFIGFPSIMANMKLVSPAFNHNEPIPMQYTCDGENMSPALAWSDAPQGTRSFALIVDDVDSPNKIWVHWIAFNIPLSVEHITENQGSAGEEVPFLQGKTDFDTQKWGGPCPPRGTHHYHFTLYALDIMLDLPAGATKQDLLSAMHGHILEKTTLIATYQRKNND